MPPACARACAGFRRRPACCRRSCWAPATAGRNWYWQTAAQIELGAEPGLERRSPGQPASAATWCACSASKPPKAEGAGEHAAATAAAKVGYKLDQLPQAQAALVSLEPMNGALRALSGGYSFAGNKFNRATQARRQPGSSFKPFLYAASFERGFNPASIVLDAPVVFQDRRGHLWRPQNDDGKFAGPMRVREALVQFAQPGVGAPARRDRRRLRAQVHQPLRFRGGQRCRPTCRCRWAPRR